MPGAKTTCKDRWRQVLAEADRIPVKHLLTIEPGISVSQTDEMSARDLVLVIPAVLHETFAANPRRHLLTLRQFLERLREIADATA